MTENEKSEKVLQAEERFKRAKADLHKAKLDAKAKARKDMDHLKYTMGGIVVKYFPECKDLSELEMCRIIACAFKNNEVKNLIITITDGARAPITDLRKMPIKEVVTEEVNE